MIGMSKPAKLSAIVLVTIALTGITQSVAFATNHKRYSSQTGITMLNTPSTNSPIQHVVVIFGENISFDHYFATYPYAVNPAGEPPFYAASGTPTVNGLTSGLLTKNPNLANPQRLDRSQPLTDDMDHDYTAEQKAFDGGLMDQFVQNTGAGDWPTPNQSPNVVMDYYDGNTVTALWNYAEHFSMSDNSYGTTFGPSTPGALNLISGQTHGAIGYSENSTTGKATTLSSDAKGVIIPEELNSNGTLFSDADPYYDQKSKGQTIEMTGKNIGDLLNEKNVTWGWFEGGFKSGASHSNIGGQSFTDYIPHHEPFQYYKSTANPNHLPPTSISMIGRSDQANHQYGLTDFFAAADAGNLPSVSFLKASAYEDAHAGYSDPLDEQKFLVNTINHLESLPTWKSTAIFLAWDDSDGWYDHVMGPIIGQSRDPSADALLSSNNSANFVDREGYGPRLPMFVISPYAKRNFVDHSISDQTSILRFIEDNWDLGRIGNDSYDAYAGAVTNMFDFSRGPVNDRLYLDASSGEPIAMATMPFSKNGELFMSVSDLAQSLNVSFIQEEHQIRFLYHNHDILIPMSGRSASVDGSGLDLGQNVLTIKGAMFVPIDKIIRALGLSIVQYGDRSILFEPVS